MPQPPKRPQLPHRLRCTESTGEIVFAGALRTAMAQVPHDRKQSANGFVDAHSVAKYTGMKYKVPLACAELYHEWSTPRGQLSHLSLDTVARLAVDVFLDELHAWVNRVGEFAVSQTPRL